MARAIPTDETLLATIYRQYLQAFSEWSDDNKSRVTKIWVPIDIDALGRKFKCDPDLIFGRLYYHMNEKYGSKRAMVRRSISSICASLMIDMW